MVDMQYFANMVRTCRKERGLTQSELAERLLVSPQSVSIWESGKGLPDLEHLLELSAVLAVGMDELFNHHPNQLRTLIGIDGGGTKTEFVLVDETGHLIDRVLLGGSNPNACGMEAAARVVRQGIDALRPTERRVAGIFLGCAGLGNRSNAEAMRSALEQACPGIQVDCASDISNVIACGAQPDNCIAAICGTGCVVYSSVNGTLTQTGGAGYLFDKCGSGYDMGRSAIYAALEERDGSGERTLLTPMVEEKLGGRAWDFIQELYRKDVSYIASFARLVQDAGQQGDPVAQRILEESARRLAWLITVAARKAPEARNLVLSGSVVQKNEQFYRMLQEHLPAHLEPQVITCPPVWGACLRSARLCGVTTPPSLELFMGQYSGNGTKAPAQP